MTRTFFQPDEFFQSLEVAHRLVFGYGHLTWEWLSPNPIRGIIYPALNVPIYWGLKLLHLDHTDLLIWAPKVLHGALAACTDIWLCELARRVAGERYVFTALYLSLTSVFHGLSLSRSMSNSLETSLTTIALCFFPWDASQDIKMDEIRKMLFFAALACVVRPTNALLWVYMMSALLWRLRRHPNHLTSVIVYAFAIGSVTLLSTVALDSAYYGALTLTPLNFLRTNLSSVSLFYGSSPWHYYISQALPILCSMALPYVLQGAWQAAHTTGLASKTMLSLVVWTIGVYSLAGHKEWRFIHPLLPLMHVLAAKAIVDTNPTRRGSSIFSKYYRQVVLLGLPAIVYVSVFHSRAQIDVMHYLRRLPSEEAHSVGFLVPCHSTPWQAYLHRPDLADPGRLWALGCEPPLSGQDVTVYQDQTDVFYASPANYLQTHFPRDVDPAFPPSEMPCTVPGAPTLPGLEWRHEWPQNLVVFGALLDDAEVRGILEEKEYREVWKSESGWEGDRRRQGGVRVWRVRPVELE